MRAVSRLLQRGFANGGGASNFARRSAALKNKFRGKGLYSFAREEAQRFLEAEVPKGNVGGWMEDGTNAIALSQVLRFFEIQPDPGVSSLMLNRLIRFAEDTLAPPMTRLESVLALMSTRPDENYERAFTTVEAVLSTMSPPPYGGSSASREMQGVWSILDISAKVLQRCGKRVPPTLNERLCQMIMRQIECTPEEELYYVQTSLLRIYAWTVRAELPEATGVLYVLVEKTSNFKSFDFATLMRSCSRHHQTTPLPVPLVMKLAQAGLMYACDCNGGDAAAMLGGIARVLSSLEPGVNEVTVRDVRSLTDHFVALLEDYQDRTLHFLDERDPLYWKGVEDVTTIAFAYELGGRMRYHHIFARFQEYIRREVGQLEPTQLAMATGILRRSNLLTPEMAKLLADRIEVVLGELRLPELSHICATFALLPSPPQWIPEAMEVAMRLMQSTDGGATLCSAGTRFNLSIAFPQETFALPIDYNQLSSRQLVDALPLAVGKPVFEGPVVNALVAKLEDRSWNGRFSTDDVLLLLSAPNPAVVTAVQQYMEHCLREAEWSTDVLFMLPIAMQQEKLYPLATDVQKALASAKVAAISPELFVSFLELLMGIWKDTDAGINEFAVVGAMDLIQAPRLLGSTLLRYLNCIQPFPSLKPSVEWLQQLTRGKTAQYIFKTFRAEEVVGFLASMHAFFTNVQVTPALEPALGELFDSSFQPLLNSSRSGETNQVSEVMARAMVLLVHLQQGMNVPLLTTADPVVERVTAGASGYAPDLQEALRCMPVPQGGRSLFSAGSLSHHHHLPHGGGSGTGGGAPSSASGDREGGPRRGRFTPRSGSGRIENEGRGSGMQGMPGRESKQDPLPESERRTSGDPLDCSEDADPFMDDMLQATPPPPPRMETGSLTPTTTAASLGEEEHSTMTERGSVSSSSTNGHTEGVEGEKGGGVPVSTPPPPTSATSERGVGSPSFFSSTASAGVEPGKEEKTSEASMDGTAGSSEPRFAHNTSPTSTSMGLSEESSSSASSTTHSSSGSSGSGTSGVSSTGSSSMAGARGFHNDDATNGGERSGGAVTAEDEEEPQRSASTITEGLSEPGTEGGHPRRDGAGVDGEDHHQPQHGTKERYATEGEENGGVGGREGGSTSPSSPSYYSKFFNSSIGVLFRGTEDRNGSDAASAGGVGATTSSSYPQASHGSEGCSSIPQPRRTILRKNVTSPSTYAANPESAAMSTAGFPSSAYHTNDGNAYHGGHGSRTSSPSHMNSSTTTTDRGSHRPPPPPPHQTATHAVSGHNGYPRGTGGGGTGGRLSGLASSFTGWGEPVPSSGPTSITSSWGTIPPASRIPTRGGSSSFATAPSSDSTMYHSGDGGGASPPPSSSTPTPASGSGGLFGSFFTSPGNGASHATCAPPTPANTASTSSTHASRASSPLSAGGSGSGGVSSMAGVAYPAPAWGSTGTAHGYAGSGMSVTSTGFGFGRVPGTAGGGAGRDHEEERHSQHSTLPHPGGGSGGMGAPLFSSTSSSSSPYAASTPRSGGFQGHPYLAGASASYPGTRTANGTPTTTTGSASFAGIPSSSSFPSASASSSSGWMNTNHPYTMNNRQHFHNEFGGGGSGGGGPAAAPAAAYPHAAPASSASPYHPMERPLQAAIRATVTRIPHLPGNGGTTTAGGSSSSSSAGLRPPSTPLPGSLLQGNSSAGGNPPMHHNANGRGGSTSTPSSSSSVRPPSFMAQGGNIFVDPASSTDRPGRVSLSPRHTGAPVIVPGTNRDGTSSSTTTSSGMEAGNERSAGRLPSSQTRSTSGGGRPGSTHGGSSPSPQLAMSGGGGGGGVRVNPHYLRQPTFAPVSPDHPKALGYTDPSRPGGYEGNSPHSLPGREEDREQTTTYRFHTHGGGGIHSPSSGMSSTSATSSSETGEENGSSAGIVDKRAHQRDMLLREPADRPLAWRSAAQKVSRVSRYTTGKAKTKAHQLLTEWLASPNARLNKKQEQELQHAIAVPKAEEKKEGKHHHRSHGSGNTGGTHATGSSGSSASGGGAGGGGHRAARRGGTSGTSRGGTKSIAGSHSTRGNASGKAGGAGGTHKRGGGGASGRSRGAHSGGGSAGGAAGSRRGHHHAGSSTSGSGKGSTGGGRRATSATAPPPATRQTRKAGGGGSTGKHHHSMAKKKGKATGNKRK